MIDLKTADYLDKMLYELAQRQLANALLRRSERLSKEQRGRILTHFSSIKELKKVTMPELIACGIAEEIAVQVVKECQEQWVDTIHAHSPKSES